MGLTDLTDPDAVRAAIAEAKELGEVAFLNKYQFGAARDYVVRHEGENYPSKAIVGAAHGYQHPELGPLKKDAFSGGAETTDKLEQLGFEVRRLKDAPLPSDASVWVVRAGRNGETEELCLEHGYCGVGWPELGDLSELDEDRLPSEIDIAYAEGSAGRARAIRAIITDFKAIRCGDLVLLPLKTQAGKIAVGTVTGDYEHRLDLPELARNVYRVEWTRTDVPRRLFGDLLKWIDRPPSVSRVPAPAAFVLEMVASGDPIRLDDGAPTDWSSLLKKVLFQLEQGDPKEDVKQSVATDGHAILEALLAGEWPIGHGVGIGTPAEVPWIGAYPKGTTPTPQEGIYVVYLFAADGSAVYLSLNQGTEKVRGGLPPLLKRARDLRAAADLTGEPTPLDLRSTAARPKKYEAANAHAVRYAADAVPDDDVLRADLQGLLGFLETAVTSGLTFHPEIEPIHLLFKWSADVEAETVALHRAVAAEHGSVWWGKFSQGANPIGAARLKQVTEQLERGIATSVFLYGGGQTVRTRLEEITLNAKDVDDERMPGYYAREQCNLFVRLSSFGDLEATWPISHLVLASDPVSSKMQGALGNQTTPLFVMERVVAPSAPAPPKVELSMGWLIEETLWMEPDLEELSVTLMDRGQVILAGPPGTGKTWIADALARYVTQDQPLQRRTIQLHPSYGYEEFVEGLRPVAKGSGISFERTDGVILQMATAMEGSEAPYVLIIDELNRANIPRVFGELLYLLEYRGKEIDLQYSRGFRLPDNLKLIGTMNTADRSIRSIDVALRRRFDIFDCPADPEVLERYYKGGARTTSVTNLVDGFAGLNADLAEQLDRHHTIGQSFFMEESFTHETLRRRWRRQIQPLIEDYFFDRPDMVDSFAREKYWPGS